VITHPGYSLSLVTAHSYEPISLTEAKLHLRDDHTSEDPLISSLILAAREYCEIFTRRAIGRQTVDENHDGFPCGALELAKCPVLSVTSISYVDQNGDTQVWSSSNYRTDLPSGPRAQRARIEPVYGVSWPSTRGVVNAVTVRYVCGYGGTSKTVSGITRSSTTATATTSAAHGYSTGQRVTIAGADQADYNGTFEITVTGATTFTFTVANSPTTPATGAMTVADLGVPSSIVAAMKLLIGHWYENREAVSVSIGANVQTVPLSVDALLFPFKAF
jgi:uncharacterized phiE125 gp8 family phage protein